MAHQRPSNPTTAGASSVWTRRGPAAAFVGLFLLGAVALWALHWTRGRAACDQYDYHLKAILKFAAELPHPDLHDYLSATTPGYHLLMAMIARLVTPAPVFLQVVASVFTLGLLGVFGWWIGRSGVRRHREWIEVAAIGLPVVLSPYVFTSGVWLLPENAAWLLVLAVFIPLVTRTITVGVLAWCGVMMVLLVLVRQSHLWIAAPVVVAAWQTQTSAGDESIVGALARVERRFRMTLLAALVCVPAVLIVAAFARMWHGLTPPFFQEQHTIKTNSRVNWATLPFILSLVAVFAPFYAGWWWDGLARLWRESRPVVLFLAFAAAAWAAFPDTTFLREPRSSGLWNVTAVLDPLAIGGRINPLILVLAPIGAVVLAAWLALIDNRCRWVVGSVVLAFIAAQSANANCWQRYHEPLLLMLFAWIAVAFGPGPGDPSWTRHGPKLATWRILGPVVLAGVLGALTLGGMLFGRDPLRAGPDTGADGAPPMVAPAGRDPGR